MSVQVIPAARIVICDSCGCRCDASFGRGRRVQDGRLIIRQHALDMLGSPAACGDVEMDLCDTCLAFINGAINSQLAKIRSNPQPPTAATPQE